VLRRLRACRGVEDHERRALWPPSTHAAHCRQARAARGTPRFIATTTTPHTHPTHTPRQRHQITLCVGPFAFVAPTAILAGMFVRDVNPLAHLALSCFATGTFLYVGASEIVEEEFEGDLRAGR
jgi:hypothetical protein